MSGTRAPPRKNCVTLAGGRSAASMTACGRRWKNFENAPARLQPQYDLLEGIPDGITSQGRCPFIALSNASNSTVAKLVATSLMA